MEGDMPASANSQPHTNLDSCEQAVDPCYFGQLLYFDKVKAAQECRPLMARIALAIAGNGKDYPILLTDILRHLRWENYLATLGFLTLAASVHIAWSPIKLAYLKKWAEETISMPHP